MCSFVHSLANPARSRSPNTPSDAEHSCQRSGERPPALRPRRFLRRDARTERRAGTPNPGPFCVRTRQLERSGRPG